MSGSFFEFCTGLLLQFSRSHPKVWEPMKFKLKHKIIVVCIVPLLAISFLTAVIIQISVERQIKHLKSNFEQYHKALDHSVSAQFFERYGDVQAFAINSDIISLDEKKIEPLLNKYAQLYGGIYDLILVLNTSGRWVGSNSILPGGKELNRKSLKTKDFSDQTWFQRTLNGNFTENKDQGFLGTFVSDPFFFREGKAIFHQELYTNIFATQIKNNQGQVIGVIANFANFKWIQDEFLTYV